MTSNNTYKDQSGLVSIIVAVVFITIISLVATSFALLSRREQRQALDRQLSTQAFYAAESGINDAVQKVKAGTTNINECSSVSSLNPTGGPGLGNEQSYTCVLVNESPSSLEFDPISINDSTVIKLQASSGSIDRVRISWQDSDGSDQGANLFATNGTFLLPQQEYNQNNPDSFANHTGIIRASLIPVSGVLSRSNFLQNTQTFFLYPEGSNQAGVAGSTAFASGQAAQGRLVNGQCNTGNNSQSFPRFCNVDITGLPGGDSYYLRLKGVYKNSRVTVQAFAAGSTDPLALTNGQVIIDATGKANDVLRRVQVRVPFSTQYDIPEAALETTDSICKQITYSQTRTNDLCDYDN